MVNFHWTKRWPYKRAPLYWQIIAEDKLSCSVWHYYPYIHVPQIGAFPALPVERSAVQSPEWGRKPGPATLFCLICLVSQTSKQEASSCRLLLLPFRLKLLRLQSQKFTIKTLCFHSSLWSDHLVFTGVLFPMRNTFWIFLKIRPRSDLPTTPNLSVAEEEEDRFCWRIRPKICPGFAPNLFFLIWDQEMLKIRSFS